MEVATALYLFVDPEKGWAKTEKKISPKQGTTAAPLIYKISNRFYPGKVRVNGMMGKGDEKGPKCSLNNRGTQRKGVRRQICLLDYSKDVHSSLLHPHQPCPEPENGLWAKRKPWASRESLHTWQGHDKDKAESAPAPGGEGALRAGWWSCCQNQLLETICLFLPHSLLPGIASRAFRDQASFGFEPTEGRGISQKDAPAWHSVPLVTNVSCPGRHLCFYFSLLHGGKGWGRWGRAETAMALGPKEVRLQPALQTLLSPSQCLGCPWHSDGRCCAEANTTGAARKMTETYIRQSCVRVKWVFFSLFFIGVVVLQYCISFCWTAKLISYMCTYIPSFLDLLST